MDSGLLSGACASLAAFRRDRRASSAVEFSIIALPFIVVLLAILQMSVYYMTQSALDSGVLAEADSLVTTFYQPTTPTTPSVASLQSAIATKSGGMVKVSTLLVDLQPFANLTLLPVAIGANAPNIGSAYTLLALRAQAPVTAFAPGFSAFNLVVRSSVLVRRQSN